MLLGLGASKRVLGRGHLQAWCLQPLLRALDSSETMASSLGAEGGVPGICSKAGDTVIAGEGKNVIGL